MPDPLLDAMRPEIPDFVTYLEDKYRAAMAARNQELAEAHGKRAGSPPQIDIEAAMVPIRTFLNFSRKHMLDNRPCELSHMEQNFGVKLMSNEMFTISPGMEETRGTMQPSNAVQVTGGQYVNEAMEGAPVPVTGHAAQVPKGATDYTLPGATSDQTQSQGPRSYDQ